MVADSNNRDKNPGIKFIDTHDPDILETRSGGGCLMLFGLPFFLAGLFVIAAVTGIISVEGDMPWYFGIPFGGVFAGVGAGLMFGRAGVIIDRRHNTVVKWWGLLVPFKRTEHRLDLYSRITLCREVRKGDKTTTIVYPVRLEGEGDVKPIHIGEPLDYQAARKNAEDLSKFLDRQLVDTSSGKRVVREADALDESIRERTIRTGDITFMPNAPPDMKTRVREEGDSIILELPPRGLNAGHYFQMAFVLAFVVIITFKILIPWTSDESGFPRDLFMGFIGIFFIMVPLLSVLIHVFSEARKWERVVADPEFLRVEQYGLRKKKVTRIPAQEIEELSMPEAFNLQKFNASADNKMKEMGSTGVPRMPDGRAVPGFLQTLARVGKTTGITARSDDATVAFGKGLPEDEIKYIHAVIMRKLAG